MPSWDGCASVVHADPDAIATSGTAWNRIIGILDVRLAETGAYAAGAEFTLADIVLGLSVHRWIYTPIEHAGLPTLHASYECLSEPPASSRTAATKSLEP